MNKNIFIERITSLCDECRVDDSLCYKTDVYYLHTLIASISEIDMFTVETHYSPLLGSHTYHMVKMLFEYIWVYAAASPFERKTKIVLFPIRFYDAKDLFDEGESVYIFDELILDHRIARSSDFSNKIKNDEIRFYRSYSD